MNNFPFSVATDFHMPFRPINVKMEMSVAQRHVFHIVENRVSNELMHKCTLK
jgi:hypothetical protein